MLLQRGRAAARGILLVVAPKTMLARLVTMKCTV